MHIYGVLDTNWEGPLRRSSSCSGPPPTKMCGITLSSYEHYRLQAFLWIILILRDCVYIVIFSKTILKKRLLRGEGDEAKNCKGILTYVLQMQFVYVFCMIVTLSFL